MKVRLCNIEEFRQVSQGRLLVPVSLAAALADVSRQRIYQRVWFDKLDLFVVCHGWTMVDLNKVKR